MAAVLAANATASLLQPSCFDSIILIKKLPYLPDLLSSASREYIPPLTEIIFYFINNCRDLLPGLFERSYAWPHFTNARALGPTLRLLGRLAPLYECSGVWPYFTNARVFGPTLLMLGRLAPLYDCSGVWLHFTNARSFGPTLRMLRCLAPVYECSGGTF